MYPSLPATSQSHECIWIEHNGKNRFAILIELWDEILKLDNTTQFARSLFVRRRKITFRECGWPKPSASKPHTVRQHTPRTTESFATVRPCATIETPGFWRRWIFYHMDCYLDESYEILDIGNNIHSTTSVKKQVPKNIDKGQIHDKISSEALREG